MLECRKVTGSVTSQISCGGDVIVFVSDRINEELVLPGTLDAEQRQPGEKREGDDDDVDNWENK